MVVSSIQKKTAMAISGLLLVGFVIGHMLGNLKIFAGVNSITREYYIDEYAHHLRELGTPLFEYSQVLWLARIVLLLAVLVHIACAISLTMQNKAAREQPYKRFKPEASTFASRTMRWGGFIVLFYIAYHIMHLTLGAVHSESFVHGKVYNNVVVGFQNGYIALVYIIANAALCFHLYHGLWSLIQTLGLGNKALNNRWKTMAQALSLVIFLGFVSVPISVFFGFIG